MMNAFTSEVAAERRRDLLHNAAGYRLATSGRRPRRHPRATALTVRVRPVRPADSPLLADLFDRLSPASRLARFLVAKRELTAAELTYFTDVDHNNHEALIATTRLRGEPIGVARFIRDKDNPTAADVAMEVADEWQNLGVGSLLAAQLATCARRAGVTHFTALMAADNSRSRRLLTKLGTLTEAVRDGTTVSYRVALTMPESVPPPRPCASAVPAGRA